MLFKNKAVLVTGGAGFVGSNLAIRLVEEGAKVSVVDSFLSQCGANLFNLEPIINQIQLHKLDLRDPSGLTQLIEGQDYIFSMAGQVSHEDSMSAPVEDLEINARSHLNILEACRRSNKNAVILYASTRQIYGAPQYLPVDEKHPIRPADINGINKYAAEQYFSIYARVFGLKTVSLRLTNSYGPRQLIKHARQGFIAWFMNRALTGQTIQLFGGGTQLRDFNHIDDVSEAFVRAALSPSCFGKVYNLSGERANLERIGNELVALTGKGRVERIEFPAERKKIDIGDYYGSSDLLTQDTGWVAKIGLSVGLKQTVEFYQRYGSHYLES